VSVNEHTLVVGFLAVVLVLLSLALAYAAAHGAMFGLTLFVFLAYAVAFMIGRMVTLRELDEDIFS
jgi:tetrahydromethanopterin S-methyltransferase subunit E